MGGNTTLPEESGIDECGVCYGTGSSCRGCDGIRNSGKVLDKCEQCMHVDDPGANTLCMSIQTLSPMSAPETGRVDVTVSGAGLVDLSCFFEKKGYRYIAEKNNGQFLHFLADRYRKFSSM